MKKEKVKKYLKENKKEVTRILIGSGLTIFGCVIGYKCGVRHVFKKEFVVGDELVKAVLTDADKVIDHKGVFGIGHDVGFKPEDLGELGKRILAANSRAKDIKFSHFVAIGKDITN